MFVRVKHEFYFLDSHLKDIFPLTFFLVSPHNLSAKVLGINMFLVNCGCGLGTVPINTFMTFILLNHECSP